MNLTLSNKNPFSTFDFLGYFFPGALTVGLCYILTNGFSEFSDELPPSFVFAKGFVVKNIGIGLFLLVIVSYVVGHIMSYTSSITIELFFNWGYGYPTQYLLGVEKKSGILASQIDGWKGIKGLLLHILVCIALMPLVLSYCIFERIFGLDSVIGRRLDDQMITRIKKLIADTRVEFGFNNDDDIHGNNDEQFKRLDIHRLIMHITYEKCVQHIVKFDNYVALYGFLRSISLIFNLAWIYLIFRFIWERNESLEFSFVSLLMALVLPLIYCIIHFFVSKNKGKAMGDVILTAVCFFLISVFIQIALYGTLNKDFKTSAEILEIILFYLSSYISYLGFAKFYRRFTLENFMAHLICYKSNKTTEVDIHSNEPIHLVIDDKSNWITSIIDKFK